MPEDRTPRIVAPTESIPDTADGPRGRGARHGSGPRTTAQEKNEPRARNGRSRLNREWSTKGGDEEDQPGGQNRVHFPFFP